MPIFDWENAPPPWNHLAPEILAGALRAGAGQPPTPLNLGTLLRQRIKARGITYAQAALELGVNRSTVEGWVNRRCAPTQGRRVAIERWLQYNPLALNAQAPWEREVPRGP